MIIHIVSHQSTGLLIDQYKGHCVGAKRFLSSPGTHMYGFPGPNTACFLDAKYQFHWQPTRQLNEKMGTTSSILIWRVACKYVKYQLYRQLGRNYCCENWNYYLYQFAALLPTVTPLTLLRTFYIYPCLPSTLSKLPALRGSDSREFHCAYRQGHGAHSTSTAIDEPAIHVRTAQNICCVCSPIRSRPSSSGCAGRRTDAESVRARRRRGGKPPPWRRATTTTCTQ